jgi:hypothetical protein
LHPSPQQYVSQRTVHRKNTGKLQNLFEGKLDEENRWIKMSKMIPWAGRNLKENMLKISKKKKEHQQSHLE